MHPYRTHTCGELRANDAGAAARLAGWLHNRRNLGNLLFIDLRDGYGLTQLVVTPESPAYDQLARLPKETVLRADGLVTLRGQDNANSELATGDIELEVNDVEVLGESDPLPFNVFPEDPVGEDKRLRHRFLDLRRERMHRNVLLRSQVVASIRRRMTDLGFHEFQTPILTSSSPEGARDFLVPSRLHPGKFFALPQAPQQFKQLLMVAGFDRYFQIAPCFRDEDSRADRSPGEFYQLDMEMSFVEQDEIFSVVEELFRGLFAEFAPDRPVATPFPRIAYRDAFLRYGTDKPDLRIPLQLTDVTDVFVASEFRAFRGKSVRALLLPGAAARPRSFFDGLERFAVEQGASGLAWLKVGEGELTGPVAKYLSDDERARLVSETKASAGDAILANAADDPEALARVMAAVRVEAGVQTGAFDEGALRFCWIVDFPMYERADDGTIDFSHNPFSMPKGGMEALQDQEPLDILAWQYDIVCNGIELSSGAIRNHRPDVMLKAFEIAGYQSSEVEDKFGGMLRALRTGAPPHGGIAPGIDRILMLIADEPNIRETIAFPLNQSAQDLMMGAPSEVSERQLRDIHIKVALPPGGQRAVP